MSNKRERFLDLSAFRDVHIGGNALPSSLSKGVRGTCDPLAHPVTSLTNRTGKDIHVQNDLTALSRGTVSYKHHLVVNWNNELLVVTCKSRLVLHNTHVVIHA